MSISNQLNEDNKKMHNSKDKTTIKNEVRMIREIKGIIRSINKDETRKEFSWLLLESEKEIYDILLKKVAVVEIVQRVVELKVGDNVSIKIKEYKKDEKGFHYGLVEEAGQIKLMN